MKSKTDMKKLTNDEEEWLKNFAKENGFFDSLLQYYIDNENLNDNQYYWLNVFIKNAMKVKKGEQPEIIITKHKIIKVPCPHCNFLCSFQVNFCSKCGEPLPRLENIKISSNSSSIIDENYAERTTIHSIENKIRKTISLNDIFKVNTTCYTKENEEITGISLFKCNLDFFPNEILKFKSLKYLALRRNNIRELPQNIGFLTKLEYLDLRINKLEKLPKAIGLLSNLKHLNLSSNTLKEIPQSIGDLNSLKVLNLNNNKLKNVPESTINLKSLEKLSLRANFWIKIPQLIKELKKQGLQVLI